MLVNRNLLSFLININVFIIFIEICHLLNQIDLILIGVSIGSLWIIFKIIKEEIKKLNKKNIYNYYKIFKNLIIMKKYLLKKIKEYKKLYINKRYYILMLRSLWETEELIFNNLIMEFLKNFWLKNIKIKKNYIFFNEKQNWNKNIIYRI